MLAQATKNSHDQYLDRITAASIDQRCHNIRYRQNQLHLLHAFLSQNVEKTCRAIQEDSDATESEALSEYFLSIATLSQLYDEIDFDESLKQEYSIASKKSNMERRVPYGIVVIRPGNFSRFFSVIAPLVAAISAGNCVLIELPKSLHRVDPIIKEAIESLDHDAFVVASYPVTDECFLSTSLLVNENGHVIPPGHAAPLADRGLNVAIVHRDANIQAAARSLCDSRLRFHGRSPYAPDIVLVNEWVKTDLVEACRQLLSREATTASSQSHARIDLETASDLNTILPSNETDNLHSSSEMQIMEFKDRNAVTALKTIRGRTLIILPVTGLTDAVTIASQIPSLFACYAFASLANAKYLCQQIDSSLSFVNDIPIQMLVGPAVPKTLYSSNSDLRYDTFMMSKPHPEYLNTESSSYRLVGEVLAAGILSQSEKASKIKAIRELALTPLKPTGQASGTSLGFFDQGILTGVVAFVLPTLSLSGIGTFYAARYVYRVYF